MRKIILTNIGWKIRWSIDTRNLLLKQVYTINNLIVEK